MLRVKGRGGVMVARHGCWGMGRSEPMVGGRDARRVGGSVVGGTTGQGAPAGQDERMGAGRIEADGADCE